MMKKIIAAVALAAMTMSAQAGVAISEGFEDLPALAASGWTFTNGSAVGITGGWFQGTNNVFSSQSGGVDSYAAADYRNTTPGSALDSWLITPVFDAMNGVDISFYLRAADDPDFSDSLAYGFTGAGASAMTVVSAVPTDGWTLYTVHLDANLMASTSFAFHYIGAADTSNFVGLDTLTVTELPEPTGIALFAAGLLGLGALRRRTRG